MERGLPQIRAPKPRKLNGEATFHKNADTGIDLDGVLKEGYVSGDVQSISPSPDSARFPFEPARRSSTFLDPSSSSTLHPRRPSATSHAFGGQNPSTRQLAHQREERETERRRRMRRAGGIVDCGTISVLAVFMAICLIAILLIYFKIR